jgi:hypothetical protein
MEEKTMSINVTCDICGKSTHTMSVISGSSWNDGWLVDLHKHTHGGEVFKEEKIAAACVKCSKTLRPALEIDYRVRREIRDRYEEVAKAGFRKECSDLTRTAIAGALTTLRKGVKKS